jgi:uncharacterized protein YecE (DUF72 family)
MTDARTPRSFVGTSGFAYASWRPAFYPPKTKPAEMLAFYAGVFRSVEINYTFNRFPSATVMASWRRQTPEGFRFALKAPAEITHKKRLKEAGPTLASFATRVGELGDKCGPILLQLPPNMKADPPRLDAVLAALPHGTEAAVEFRHESWFSDAVYALLESRRTALCIAESDDLATPCIATAPYGYLRLRRPGYTDADLAVWADRIRGESRWKRVYAYVKHDEAGVAPALAQTLTALLSD